MIFGCGVEMAGITVSRGIVKWFAGKEMALAMGVEMALARVGVFAVFIGSPWIATLGDNLSVTRPVGFAVLLLLIGLICFIVYGFMDKKLESQIGNTEEKEDPFRFSDLGKIFPAECSGLSPSCACCIIQPFSHSRNTPPICSSAS